MAGRPLREIRGSFGGVSGLDILHLVERAIMGLLLCIPGDGPTIHDESTPGNGVPCSWVTWSGIGVPIYFHLV